MGGEDDQSSVVPMNTSSAAAGAAGGAGGGAVGNVRSSTTAYRKTSEDLETEALATLLVLDKAKGLECLKVMRGYMATCWWFLQPLLFCLIGADIPVEKLRADTIGELPTPCYSHSTSHFVQTHAPLFTLSTALYGAWFGKWTAIIHRWSTTDHNYATTSLPHLPSAFPLPVALSVSCDTRPGTLPCHLSFLRSWHRLHPHLPRLSYGRFHSRRDAVTAEVEGEGIRRRGVDSQGYRSGSYRSTGTRLCSCNRRSHSHQLG